MVGDPPDSPQEAAARLVAGRGALSVDLKTLMQAHFARMAFSPELLALTHAHPKVRRAHDGMLRDLRDRLAGWIEERLSSRDPWTVALPATLTLEAGRPALHAWKDGEAAEPGPALDRAWDSLAEVASLAAPAAPGGCPPPERDGAGAFPAPAPPKSSARRAPAQIWRTAPLAAEVVSAA